MDFTKMFTGMVMITIFSGSASAWWFGIGVDTNGPYKVFKYSKNVTCDVLQEKVEHEGALVVWESAQPAIYNLRVSHGGYCPSSDQAKADYVTAKDGLCMLYECVQSESGSSNN